MIPHASTEQNEIETVEPIVQGIPLNCPDERGCVEVCNNNECKLLTPKNLDRV